MKKITIWLAVAFIAMPITEAQAQSAVETSLTRVTALIETDIDKAETLIEGLLEDAPANPEVHFLCGRIMGRQASDAIFSALSYAGKSLDCFKAAVSLAPSSVRYQQGLLRFYLGAPAIAGGSEALAREQVEKIRQINPVEGAKAELMLLASIAEPQQLSARLAELREQYPEVSDFHFRHGLQLQEQNQYGAAYEAFIEALSAAEKSLVTNGLETPESIANGEIADDEQAQRDYLNALYQIGRNAVFSQAHIEHGIRALRQYVTHLEKGEALTGAPPITWGYLRLAQLHSLEGETEKMRQNLTLAEKSEDKALHKAARKLRRLYTSD
ncbi:hypothetical protein [Alteromonas sp. H39]|uniref:hypothetical protein n=1 Tax=Alteromonas sp. H39 TaxID=3389876 RepID=UPI0039DFA2A9